MILESKAMYVKGFLTAFLFFILFFRGSAQECTLGVGGKNTETLIKIFQLNETQASKMEELVAELAMATKLLEDDIQKLFDTHPQSTPDELTLLSEKYKVLEERLVAGHRQADIKVLSTFNQKQYERYLALCNEAVRIPLVVVPATVHDSIVDPK